MLRGWSEITPILTYGQMYPQSMFLIAPDMLQWCVGKKCLSPLYFCIQYMGYWVVQLQYWWQCQAKSVVILWYRIMITWHEQQEWMLVSVSDGTQGITVSYDIVFHRFSSAQNHERCRLIRSFIYIDIYTMGCQRTAALPVYENTCHGTLDVKSYMLDISYLNCRYGVKGWHSLSETPRLCLVQGNGVVI